MIKKFRKLLQNTIPEPIKVKINKYFTLYMRVCGWMIVITATLACFDIVIYNKLSTITAFIMLGFLLLFLEFTAIPIKKEE